MRTTTGTARLTTSTFVAGVAALIAVAALASLAVRVTREGLADVDVLAAFALAIAVGECLRVQLGHGRDAAPIGTAAAFGLALLPELGPTQSVQGGAATMLVVVIVGTIVGIAPHLLAGRSPDRDAIAHRFIAIAALTAGFRELPLGSHGTLVSIVDGWEAQRWRVAAVMLAAVLTALLIDAFLGGAIRAARERSQLRPVIKDELRDLVGMGSAIGSTGILIALAARPMGLLALPVFLAPLLLTQFAFRRYATVRATYNQTIRSLSRVTELGGYTETGHSVRVAELAVAMGRRLGLGERELRDLEYAALLHDIGQLSLSEPIPGGATVMAAPMQQRRIADLGAEVVRQAGVLDTVATIVAQQTEPYRRRHETEDVDVPLSSRIIKVANAYDDLVGESVGRARRLEALERIHLGLAYEYDPRVVGALGRVISRLN